jgi:hypothetical protein
MMQIFRLGTFTTLFLMTLWGGGCNKDKDSDTAGPEEQPCQAATLENSGKYLCPKGFFCKYDDDDDKLHPKKLGKCADMSQYEPCMNITLCGSADYSPKCETVNETAYCDWHQTSLRCRCDKPGPFIEGDADGNDVKTPTTTK